MRQEAHVRLLDAARRYHAPGGILARTWPSGRSALWMILMLLALLVSGYLV